VVESGRHTSLRTRRPLHGSSSLPRPTSFTPVAESVDATRSKRVSTCRFDSCREYCSPTASHAPDRTVTVAASKTAIRGFNSSRVCHVGDAEVVEAAVRKTVLTAFESRLSLHRRARSDGNAFWSRKPALREGPGWGFDSSALRHYIKVLDFFRSLHLLYKLRDDTSYPFRDNAASHETSVRRYP
jgi:hypothetical protein